MKTYDNFQKSIQIDPAFLTEISTYKEEIQEGGQKIPYKIIQENERSIDAIVSYLVHHQFSAVNIINFGYWNGKKETLNSSYYENPIPKLLEFNTVALIERLKAANIKVYCMLLGNAFYGSKNKLISLLDNPETGLKKEWTMQFLGDYWNSEESYKEGTCFFSFHHKDYVKWQTNRVRTILQTDLFDGIEFAESYFLGWDTIDRTWNDTTFYSDVNKLVVYDESKPTEGFVPYVETHSISEEITQIVSDLKRDISILERTDIMRIIHSNKELYQLWIEFRSQAVTQFHVEMMRVVNDVNQKISQSYTYHVWTMGETFGVKEGLASEDELKEGYGLDNQSLVQNVNADCFMIQTSSSDWNQAYLGTGYIQGYQRFLRNLKRYISEKTKEKNRVTVGLQVDFGTKYYRYCNEHKAGAVAINKTSTRGESWFHSVAEKAQKEGYGFITGYEFGLATSAYRSYGMFYTECGTPELPNVYAEEWPIRNAVVEERNRAMGMENKIRLYKKPSFHVENDLDIKEISQEQFRKLLIRGYEKNSWIRVELKELDSATGQYVVHDYFANPTGEEELLENPASIEPPVVYTGVDGSSQKITFLGKQLVYRAGEDKNGKIPIHIRGEIRYVNLQPQEYIVTKDVYLHTSASYLSDKSVQILKNTIVYIQERGENNWLKVLDVSNGKTGWINDLGEPFLESDFPSEMTNPKIFYLHNQPAFFGENMKPTVNYREGIAKQPLTIDDRAKDNWIKIRTGASNKWLNVEGGNLELKKTVAVFELPFPESKLLGRQSTECVQTEGGSNQWRQIKWVNSSKESETILLEDATPTRSNTPENDVTLNTGRGWIHFDRIISAITETVDVYETATSEQPIGKMEPGEIYIFGKEENDRTPIGVYNEIGEYQNTQWIYVDGKEVELPNDYYMYEEADLYGTKVMINIPGTNDNYVLPKGTKVNVISTYNEHWLYARFEDRKGYIRIVDEQVILDDVYPLYSLPSFFTKGTAEMNDSIAYVYDRKRDNWLKVRTDKKDRWINIGGEPFELTTFVYQEPTPQSTILDVLNCENYIVQLEMTVEGWIKVKTINNEKKEIIGWIDQQSNQTPVLYGVENISITQGSVFDPTAGVTATDRAGRDLTEFIVFEGTVDTAIPKSYKVIYRVLDSYKTLGVAERIVTVIPINK